MKPPYRIEQAFLHLTFSIKLFRYFELGHVQHAVFDCRTEISTPQGLLQYPATSFNSTRDLILGAQNVYSSALGVCAIALETALSEHGIRNSPTDRSPSGDLRSFVYQIRNAFAHDAMTPSWSAKGAYRRRYNLTTFGLPVVDLGMLDGQALDLHDFGGMQGFQLIRDAVVRWICDGSPARREA